MGTEGFLEPDETPVPRQQKDVHIRHKVPRRAPPTEVQTYDTAGMASMTCVFLSLANWIAVVRRSVNKGRLRPVKGSHLQVRCD